MFFKKYKLAQKSLFIHIPKTAGTSFRSAISMHGVYSDYGINSKSTNFEIKRLIYEHNDFYQYKCNFLNSRQQWLCGHVPLVKYIDFVSVRNIFTFLRNPVSHLLSHYNHFVNHKGYEGDLDSFILSRNDVNIQTIYLNYLPLPLIGCVGITEYYADSIDLINKCNNLKLSVDRENVNVSKKLTESNISSEDIVKYTQLLNRDIEYYQQALSLFLQRKEYFKNGKEWVYAYAVVNNHSITGCAYFNRSDEYVVLDLIRNGKSIAKLNANSYFSSFPKAVFPRSRYIGFTYPLENSSSEDIFDIIVVSTGQKINLEPLKLLSHN
ncbi:sulfotransferase family 2 domain-containing protein [Shewanella aestuarii]|uniref:Sulfotransferase family 2 domain-containing protein n=1 Tax=Shewanella aestuarii TaxID=1028752 RepID=A0A6G9QL62_9GAMM|nr:sulfotransferase family 2 domain-containing protein [Shewanella aestuarii]QIR15128.1 sulfotransferase family 2 domain-containing protein [Shewanella aestuarii]